MTHDLIMPLLEKVKLQKVAKKFKKGIYSSIYLSVNVNDCQSDDSPKITQNK